MQFLLRDDAFSTEQLRYVSQWHSPFRKLSLGPGREPPHDLAPAPTFRATGRHQESQYKLLRLS
ncbi:MAG: hypothetical protein KJ556_20760, partial [Gammaproteobacteria bacterium]|nr:hypothetical protein [Gammaproteobacteria bacterium]